MLYNKPTSTLTNPPQKYLHKQKYQHIVLTQGEGAFPLGLDE